MKSYLSPMYCKCGISASFYLFIQNMDIMGDFFKSYTTCKNILTPQDVMMGAIITILNQMQYAMCHFSDFILIY